MGAAAIGLCLSLAAAAAGTAPVFVATERFTLAWTHSIEKTRWEEDYRVVLGVTEPADGAAVRLHATQARIRGSGAGMEPPPGAVLSNGWYHYRPAEAFPAQLLLSRSAYVPDYDLCLDGRACRPIAHWLPSDGRATQLKACTGRH
jgi:hypothetical protein